jgi:hypothetical protein
VNSSQLRSRATAVVVGGDSDTQHVLRSLLRLHRILPSGAAQGLDQALELVRARRPSLLLLNSDDSCEDFGSLIANSRAILSELRVVLIAPASYSLPAGVDDAHRPNSILLCPFTVRQFADAVTPTDGPHNRVMIVPNRTQSPSKAGGTSLGDEGRGV